jgi:Flp pilus assembly protein TadG
MMMRRILTSFLKDNRGAAAAEMALVTPLLIALTFGPMELGNYFLSAHTVSKAVRDGARYAGRRGFAEFTCSTASTDVIDKTRNVVRTGQIASGGTARLRGWTAATTISVEVTCNTGFTNGIYTGKAGGAPVVTVTAAVPYASLFGALGFNATSLTIRGASQSAVMGV